MEYGGEANTQVNEALEAQLLVVEFPSEHFPVKKLRNVIRKS